MVILALLLLVPAATRAPAAFSVRSLVVTKTGMSEPQNAGIDLPGRCRPFRPAARSVLVWFRSARRIAVAAAVEADRSQCLARGTLIAGDGRRHDWELDQAGLATIDPASRHAIYLSGKALPFRVGSPA